MTEYTDAREHYERMIDEIDDPAHPVTDPFHDTGLLRAWMEQTDGPAFFAALGEVRGKTALEIGVGTGRVARKLLDRGCASLTGIDVSPKTLARARENLAGAANLELVLACAGEFRRPAAFDLAYSVWTFFHIEDQPRALANIVASLKPGGVLVLSLEPGDEVLDYGPRLVRQYPIAPDTCAALLRDLGSTVDAPVPVMDAVSNPDRVLTIILRAVKVA